MNCIPICGQVELGDAASAPMVRALSPTYIFSTPTASATSAAPEATSSQAPRSAVAALAQAFSTLMIGIPVIPECCSNDLPAHTFLAGQQAAERIADIGDVDVCGFHAGIFERVPDRRIGDVLERLLGELAGRVRADADDRDVTHSRSPPFGRHVFVGRTSLFSGVSASGSITSRISMPSSSTPCSTGHCAPISEKMRGPSSRSMKAWKNGALNPLGAKCAMVWLNRRPVRPISTSRMVPLRPHEGHTGIFGKTTVPQAPHLAPSNAGDRAGSDGTTRPCECAYSLKRNTPPNCGRQTPKCRLSERKPAWKTRAMNCSPSSSLPCSVSNSVDHSPSVP